MKQYTAYYQPKKPDREQPINVIRNRDYAQEQIITHGVHNFSYEGFFVAASGYITVKKIRNTGKANEKRQNSSNRVALQCDDQKNYGRYHRDPEKGDPAWEVYGKKCFSGFYIIKETFVNDEKKTHSGTKNSLYAQKNEKKYQGEGIDPGNYEKNHRFHEIIDTCEAPNRPL